MSNYTLKTKNNDSELKKILKKRRLYKNILKLKIQCLSLIEVKYNLKKTQKGAKIQLHK